ncbi:MAG: hypothetical protein FWC22_08000 [Treponema sp.]|nr:hypothetical protein [Treponema sp.]
MSDQQIKSERQGLVKPYINFIDTNVLFKKPISCLSAIVSCLIPVYVLSQFISSGVFKIGDAKHIVAAILIVLVLTFAGVFGALIWWHRRIIRDEGPKYYDNFRRFIQTTGEWLATFLAISIFGIVIILLILLPEEYHLLTYSIPFSIPAIDVITAFYGIICGFIIIIATKILLFLLDPIIWLIKQLWKLIVRAVLFLYRCVISLAGTVEKNTPIWIGVTWLFSIAVIITCLVLCFYFGTMAPVIGLIASLIFLGYMLFKRKHYDV